MRKNQAHKRATDVTYLDALSVCRGLDGQVRRLKLLETGL